MSVELALEELNKTLDRNLERMKKISQKIQSHRGVVVAQSAHDPQDAGSIPVDGTTNYKDELIKNLKREVIETGNRTLRNWLKDRKELEDYIQKQKIGYKLLHVVFEDQLEEIEYLKGKIKIYERFIAKERIKRM